MSNNTIFTVRPMVKLVAFALAGTLLTSPMMAEEGANQEKIVITGSRIKRSELEGAATVVTLTADEMQQQGFTTVYEALRSLTAQTGGVIGEQFTEGFNPNAQALNLRGLGPGRTLILLNGRRVADYPTPYDGASNFTNLSQIPMAIVERVEVLAGGASAIYGSDALAGVVNIITKVGLEEQEAGVRIGDTQNGGGASQRLYWTGGAQKDTVNALWAIEYFTVDPILGADRPFTDQGDSLAFGLSLRDLLNGIDIDPTTQTVCDDLGYNFLSTADSTNSVNICTASSSDVRSLTNERERLNLYTRLGFETGDTSELFLELHYWDTDSKSLVTPRFWRGVDGGVASIPNPADPFDFASIDSAFNYSFQRFFFEDELPGQGIRFEENGVDFTIGLSGLIDQQYDFKVALTHSFQDSTNSQLLLLEPALEQFYLGNRLQQGGVDVFFAGLPVYQAPLNILALTQRLTPQQAAQISDIDVTNADASVTSLTFELSGDLLEFGDDYAQFAFIVEAAKQDYEINLDARRLATDGSGFFGVTGTTGEGDRSRYALGLETRWPIIEGLDVTLAGRYDKYDDITEVDDAITYNLGVEYRPIDGLLLRATGTSNFRAPDMHYVFASGGGFFQDIFDPLINPAIVDPNYSVPGLSVSNPSLEEETGESFSFGFVYEPLDGLSFSADVYQIEVDDQVERRTVGSIVRECAEIFIADPSTVDPALCEVEGGILTRDLVFDQGRIDGVTLIPINIAFNRQRGIDTSLKYTINTNDWGTFFFTANHTAIFESQRQLTSDPATLDEGWRSNPNNNDLRSRFRSSSTWTYSDWRVTLLSNRIGSLIDAEELLINGNVDRLDAWTIYNASVSYAVTPELEIDFIINNLTNEFPRIENSVRDFPGYNSQHYNAIRRAWFLEAKYSF